MNSQSDRERENPRDRLMARPDDPLPTPLDPQSPEARVGAKDPKPVPATGQGDPHAKNPSPRAIERSA
jgi:hypothetical protein